MGTIAFAAGGGLAGLGEGLADVGKENLNEMRQRGLENLRQQHEQERQKAQFGEEEKLQGKQQEFTKGQAERGYEVSARAAGAQREFTEKENKAKIEATHENVERIASSRENVARIRGGQQGAKGKPPLKEFDTGLTKYTGTIPNPAYDPKNPQKAPAFIAGDLTAQTLKHKGGGLSLVQVGDRFMPWDGNVANMPKSSSVRRAATADEQDLAANPERWGPFLQRYHYLPRSWHESYTAKLSAMDQEYNSRQGNNPPPTITDDDAGSDNEDHNIAAGGSGVPEPDSDYKPDYANTGDIGPQASDTQRAQ